MEKHGFCSQLSSSFARGIPASGLKNKPRHIESSLLCIAAFSVLLSWTQSGSRYRQLSSREPSREPSRGQSVALGRCQGAASRPCANLLCKGAGREVLAARRCQSAAV